MEEKIREFEDVFRGLMDEIRESQLWEWDGTYTYQGNIASAAVRAAGYDPFEIAENDDIDVGLAEHDPVPAGEFRFEHRDHSSVLRFDLETTQEDLVQGVLEYQVNDPTIRNNQQGEPGPLLSALRDAQTRIAEQHLTGYLSTPRVPAGGGYEDLVTIHVPRDYQGQEFEASLKAIESISREVEGLYKGLLETVEEYAREDHI